MTALGPRCAAHAASALAALLRRSTALAAPWLTLAHAPAHPLPRACLQAELEDMRKFVELEASTADPAQLAELKRAWKQKARAAAAAAPAPAAMPCAAACRLPPALSSLAPWLLLCPRLSMQFAYAARLNPAEIFSDPELAAAALRPDVSRRRLCPPCPSACAVGCLPAWRPAVPLVAACCLLRLIACSHRGCTALRRPCASQAMRIVVEVNEDPSKLEKYRDDPQMYTLLKRIMGV